MKPNCYKCKWRGKISGDEHSCCNHPENETINKDPLIGLMSILGSVGRAPPMQIGIEKLGVKGNSHGIKNGWFNWPMNFDPIWLESCNGFEKKQLI